MKAYIKKENKNTRHGPLSRLSLIKDRRAVNTVISNMILIAAVIVLGFVVLSFARSDSADYQARYQQTVSYDIEKLKETLSFEYTYYNATAKELRVYVMNAGTIELQVDKIYLNTGTESIPFEVFTLDGQEATDHNIARGAERMILLSNLELVSGTYNVKLSTLRGLTFANTFVF
jgi:archaellum component FlaF (FlaF/FlaG flagellin family)